MDVLVQVLFQRVKPLIERLKACTTICGCVIVLSQCANLLKNFTGAVMLAHHYAHGVIYRDKTGLRLSRFVSDGLLHLLNIGKEHDLFFLKMWRKISDKQIELLSQLQ